jgi:hypothetical protein
MATTSTASWAWLICPTCDRRADIGTVLINAADVILGCYECDGHRGEWLCD